MDIGQFLVRKFIQIFPLEKHLSQIRVEYARKNCKESAFAGAGFAHHGDELSFIDRDLQRIQDLSSS